MIEYEVVRHGAEYADYWQGIGVALSKYQYVFTGLGYTEMEALDDCLDQIAMEFPSLGEFDFWAKWKTEIVEQEGITNESDIPNDMASDLAYRISIRF